MSNGSVRGLNLYSFYAILLPGIAFTIALVPLLPANSNINPLLAVIPLVAIGFVVGQGLHTLGVLIQSVAPRNEIATSHREFITGLLTDKSIQFKHNISDKICRRFVHCVNSSIDLPESEDSEKLLEDDFSSNSEEDIQFVYAVIRSQIHADGTGRSRVFQSTYAFCRSVMVMIPLLWLIYALYVVLDWFDIPSKLLFRFGSGSVSESLYTPIVDTVASEPGVIMIFTTIITAMGFLTFQSATKQYKSYYVEYTLADFISQSSSKREYSGSGDPNQNGSNSSRGGGAADGSTSGSGDNASGTEE
jgi:hypothetical protein